MKKLILKIVTCLVVASISLSLVACTYRAEGSVIQDVTFNVSYETTESKSIDVTAKFYKTFAPKTTEHLLKLIKNNYYENTSVVMGKGGNHLILGAFNYNNGNYEEIIYTGDSVEGEFTLAGRQSRLKAEAGTLVLMREPDTGKGTSKKYNTGKAVIALLLEEVSFISNDIFCVFGKINSEAIEDLKDMRDELLTDADGDSKIRYIGDRNEEDNLTVENGKYVGGLEYYLNLDSSEIKDINKNVIEAEISEGVENELYKKLTEVNVLDVYALPTKPIKVSGFKLK